MNKPRGRRGRPRGNGPRGRGHGKGASGGAPPADLPRPPPPPALTDAEAEEVRLKRLGKNKSKHARLNARRKARFEADRAAADHALRTDAAPFLWRAYRAWAGEQLSAVEASAEEWGPDVVLSVGECFGQPLAKIVRAHAGADYAERFAGEAPAAAPGVACVLLASSAVRAVALARSLYDGAPVGKLFSKHLDVAEQARWLRRHARAGPARSAVGTARRVHLLVDEGHLSLDRTAVLFLDCARDAKRQNILDMKGPRDELFALLHEHVRPLLREKKIKIIVHVPRDLAAPDEPASGEPALGEAVSGETAPGEAAPGEAAE